MNLKQAFQIQSKLNLVFGKIYDYFVPTSFEKITETKKLSELNQYTGFQLKDEVKDRSGADYNKFNVETLIKMSDLVVKTRHDLAAAISLAKNKPFNDNPFSYDAAMVRVNDLRKILCQNCGFSGVFDLKGIKNPVTTSEQIRTKTLINGDNNLTLEYTVEMTSEIDSKVIADASAYYDKIQEEADELSSAIETYVYTTTVDYELPESLKSLDFQKIYKSLENK